MEDFDLIAFEKALLPINRASKDGNQTNSMGRSLNPTKSDKYRYRNAVGLWRYEEQIYEVEFHLCTRDQLNTWDEGHLTDQNGEHVANLGDMFAIVFHHWSIEPDGTIHTWSQGFEKEPMKLEDLERGKWAFRTYNA